MGKNTEVTINAVYFSLSLLALNARSSQLCIDDSGRRLWTVFSGNRVSRGLINRRNAEWDVYSNGIYKQWWLATGVTDDQVFVVFLLGGVSGGCFAVNSDEESVTCSGRSLDDLYAVYVI